jgi:HK97 gp10 family phage protein
MPKTSFEFSGTDQLLAALRRKGQGMSKRVESIALRAAGQVMAEEMSNRAERSDVDRKYHMQDNVKVSNVRRKDGMKYVLIGPNKHVSWRAHWHEYGTSKQQAKPFIEPAYIAKRRESLQVIADELRKGLRS